MSEARFRSYTRSWFRRRVINLHERGDAFGASKGIYQRYLGGDPSRGRVIFPQSGRKNWGISPHFRRRRRREKFLSTFFEIFVKFVNKNAIKSDFWGDCVEVSRKFSKNPRFWQKSISTLGRNFEKYFYRGALISPQKSPWNVLGNLDSPNYPNLQLIQI